MPSVEAWARCATEKRVVRHRDRRAPPVRGRMPDRSSPRRRGSAGFPAAATPPGDSELAMALCAGADAVGREGDALAAERFGDTGDERAQRHLGTGSVRPAEMRQDRPPWRPFGELVDGRRQRSMRVASVTLPSFIGTLKSARSSTRLPATSTSSSVRNVLTVYLRPVAIVRVLSSFSASLNWAGQRAARCGRSRRRRACSV